MHYCQYQYSCWKHFWKPLEEIVFITALAVFSSLGALEAESCENTFKGHIVLLPYTCCNICNDSVGEFPKYWLNVIFSCCFSNAISAFDKHYSSLTCIVWQNLALQTYFFLTTSHVPLISQ